MAGRLKAKVAIVTGGGTGIGEAICRRFAREGAKVVVSGLPDDPLDDVARAIVAEDGEAITFAGYLHRRTWRVAASTRRSTRTASSTFS